MPRVAVVIQARMSSSRLPGKVLMPLAGAPALTRMMERVARVKRADAAVVATSTDPSDDVLASTCEAHGLPVTRGPLHDVLARFVAAVPPDSDVVVRLTGDCPLVDPDLVDRHIQLFLEGGADVVTNAIERTFPDGLDVEVTSRAFLERAHREATSAHDREHVMPFVHRTGRGLAVTQETDLSALRWTLDTPDDHSAIAGIFAALHPEEPAFTSRDVYALLLRRPDLLRVDGSASKEPWLEQIRQHLSISAGRAA